jgi:hypothetical protein
MFVVSARHRWIIDAELNFSSFFLSLMVSLLLRVDTMHDSMLYENGGRELLASKTQMCLFSCVYIEMIVVAYTFRRSFASWSFVHSLSRHVQKVFFKSIAGVRAHYTLVFVIGCKAPLRTTTHPTFRIWQLDPHSRFLSLSTEYLEIEDRAFYDFDPDWRHCPEFYFYCFGRFLGSEGNPRFWRGVDEWSGCSICTVWELLGVACCSCDWGYKSQVNPPIHCCCFFLTSRYLRAPR